MNSANARMRARRMRQRKARRLIILIASLTMLGIPFALWFIDFPVNLIVAIPLGAAAVWLFLMRNVS